jgi:hypothetical protein
MPVTTLPASSFAEALPYLRAPYTPSLIRFRIETVPDNSNQPCVVVLYVTSETVMDRFNIICGEQWSMPEYTVLAHRQDDKTHHVKALATFKVFGRAFTDKGEASGESEVKAEFNANARAFKRAARWPGPGQSLYQPCTIKMFRGVGEGKLPTWSNDPKKPHIDEAVEKYLLRHYEKVLAQKIIPIYGEPFDHLAALNGALTAVNRRAEAPAVASSSPSATPAVTQQIASGPADESAPASESTPQSSSPRRRAASNSSAAAIRDAARKAGYTDELTERLIALVRDEKSELSAAHADCVREWMAVLGRLEVPEAKILESVTSGLVNCSTRQGAQVKFGQWVAVRASAGPTGPPSAGALLANGASPDPAAPSASDAQAAGAADPQIERDAAMAELTAAVACHDYTERAAGRIAALAIGADPDAKIALEKIAPATLRLVGELIDAAATLEWSTGKLDEEVSRAHNNTQQGTSASRFGAFATHLVNSAEARIEEAARAAEAAAASV